MSKWYHDTGLLVLRVLAGLGIATHGYGKLFTEGRMEGFVEMVGGMGFPLPVLFAWLAALSELLGGLLLAAGLFTRYAAFFVFGTMTVAAFIAHAGETRSTFANWRCSTGPSCSPCCLSGAADLNWSGRFARNSTG